LKYITFLLYSDIFKKIIESKTKLIKFQIVIEYISTFNNITSNFFKDDKIIFNMRDHINYNVVKSIDCHFLNFIKNINEWWQYYNTINDCIPVL